MNFLLVYLGPNNETYDLCLKTFFHFQKPSDEVFLISDREREIQGRFHYIPPRELCNEVNDPFFFLESPNVRMEHKADYLKFKWLSRYPGTFFDSTTIHLKDYHDLYNRPDTFTIQEGNVIAISNLTNTSFDNTLTIRLNNLIHDSRDYCFIMHDYEMLVKLNYSHAYKGFLDSFRTLDYEVGGVKFLSYLRYFPIAFKEQVVLWKKPFSEEYYNSMMSRLDTPYSYGLKLMKASNENQDSRILYARRIIKDKLGIS